MTYNSIESSQHQPTHEMLVSSTHPDYDTMTYHGADTPNTQIPECGHTRCGPHGARLAVFVVRFGIGSWRWMCREHRAKTLLFQSSKYNDIDVSMTSSGRNISIIIREIGSWTAMIAKSVEMCRRGISNAAKIGIAATMIENAEMRIMIPNTSNIKRESMWNDRDSTTRKANDSMVSMKQQQLK